MSVSNISPHFTWAEAACHCGAEVPLELQPNARHLALQVLEPIRERWDGPIIPVSWYRTRWYNTAIQGAEKSQHVLALAADIRPTDMADLQRLRVLIEQMSRDGQLPALGGLGIYGNWIHVDARQREDGHVARWWGKGVGSEQ